MPKITSYTVEKKLEVVKWYRVNGTNIHKTSREFKIDRKRVREWIAKESFLEQHGFGQAKKKRKLGSGRKPLSDELDDSLFEFLETERNAGRAVSNKLLAQKAIEIAERLAFNNFKASDQFIKNWKRRFHVSMRKGTNESQRTPEELGEAIQGFLQNVKAMRIRNDYTNYNIANMDQTMVRFDCPANRTNNIIGEPTIRIANTGCTKRGFTVALSARASGHKLPAFCIFKEKDGKIPPRAYKSLRIPENVRVSATTNGWMTAEKFEEWLNRIWSGNVDDVRRLLILDQAHIHKTAAATDALLAIDTDRVLIAAGCTGIIQPADVYWNKPFKTKLVELWSGFMRVVERNARGNFQRPTRQNVLNWVSLAWESVSEETIIKSFKGCGISSALDGSENGEFHEKLATAIRPVEEDLQQECVDLLFDQDDSDTSFDGFSESSESE